MEIMNQSKNREFFSKLWKCPLRRGWRYGRKVLMVFALSISVWAGLNFLALFFINASSYPPLPSLMMHALLTISLSLLLIITKQQLDLRLRCRFQPIRAFNPHRQSYED